MSRFERLRRMRWEEIGWRVPAMGRIHRDRIAFAVRPATWDRGALLHVLAADVVDPAMRAGADGEDWLAVQRGLVRLFSKRPSRFPIRPERAADLRRLVVARWPGSAEEAVTRAEPLVAGRFDLLGYRDLSFATSERSVDWQFDPVHGRSAPSAFWADVRYLDPACGDHKLIWELNRHQHWLALGRALWLTGDPRYGLAITEQLDAWMRDNPPLRGINWASMLELGFRSLSWIAALHFLIAEPPGPFDRAPWLVDLLVGLDRQLTHVEQNLSYYFSPNTHLTGEALALYVAGRSLPELASSARWTRTGREILVHEIDRQIGRDGGHLERSMHYHRYTLDFYLLALLVAERSGDRVAVAPFRDAVSRLATFARALADDQGRLAMIGDDDGGMLWPIAGRNPADVRDSLALAAAVLDRPELAPWATPEEAVWLWGDSLKAGSRDVAETVSESMQRRSRVFPDTGYAVMRDGVDHLIFDVGAHGFLNGGHAHADALAVTLTVDGTPLLVDPGSATYTKDPVLRDRMRDASAHNTLTIDGQAPSVPSGPFHWRSRADARLSTWRANERLVWAEGEHDGYGATTHRRSIVHTPDHGWLFVDDVLDAADCTADLYWHFDPGWDVSPEGPRRLHAARSTGQHVWLLHDAGELTLVRGDEATGHGWCSPVYGSLVPAWTARLRRQLSGRSSLVTWIGGRTASERLERAAAPSLERLDVDHDPACPAVGVRVVTAGSPTLTTVLRPGDAADREFRHAATADFRSDARLLHYSHAPRNGAPHANGDQLHMLAIADATHVTAVAADSLSVTCDRRVDDLCLLFSGEAIDIVASAPPSQLTLQRTAVAARIVRLNGRELAPIRRRGDAIAISAAAWGDAAPDARTTCVA